MNEMKNKIYKHFFITKMYEKFMHTIQRCDTIYNKKEPRKMYEKFMHTIQRAIMLCTI